MRTDYVIEFGEQTVSLKFYEYEEDDVIDMDKLLLINHSNILAEIITFPVILNRFGLLLSEMENKLSMAELDCKVFKAKKRKDIRKKYEVEKKKWSVDIIDDDYRSDPTYKAKQIRAIQLKKKHSIMNSIYWSLKDKSDKLNKISEKIQPGDMNWDKLAKNFNGVDIKILSKLIV